MDLDNLIRFLQLRRFGTEDFRTPVFQIAISLLLNQNNHNKCSSTACTSNTSMQLTNSTSWLTSINRHQTHKCIHNWVNWIPNCIQSPIFIPDKMNSCHWWMFFKIDGNSRKNNLTTEKKELEMIAHYDDCKVPGLHNDNKYGCVLQHWGVGGNRTRGNLLEPLLTRAFERCFRSFKPVDSGGRHEIHLEHHVIRAREIWNTVVNMRSYIARSVHNVELEKTKATRE